MKWLAWAGRVGSIELLGGFDHRRWDGGGLMQTYPAEHGGRNEERGGHPHERGQVSEGDWYLGLEVGQEGKCPEADCESESDRESGQCPRVALPEGKPRDGDDKDAGHNEQTGDDCKEQGAEFGQSGSWWGELGWNSPEVGSVGGCGHEEIVRVCPLVKGDSEEPDHDPEGADGHEKEDADTQRAGPADGFGHGMHLLGASGVATRRRPTASVTRKWAGRGFGLRA